MSRIEEILFFWFGEPRDDKTYYEERSKLWFTPDPNFDQAIRDRFLVDYQLAAERKLMEWSDTPRSSLALILLLDQFPRNMFRGNPRAFATDPLACEIATLVVQSGTDQRLLPVERMFVYMPFMHSEDLVRQQRSVHLFQQLAQLCPYLNSVSYAVQHRETVERFGRFPHRNAILGRPSTLDEAEFLKRSESSS
jgi:uncharacterized protein (DUF924 family)